MSAADGSDEARDEDNRGKKNNNGDSNVGAGANAGDKASEGLAKGHEITEHQHQHPNSAGHNAGTDANDGNENVESGTHVIGFVTIFSFPTSSSTIVFCNVMSQMKVRLVLARDLGEGYELTVCTSHTLVNLPRMCLCNLISFYIALLDSDNSEEDDGASVEKDPAFHADGYPQG